MKFQLIATFMKLAGNGEGQIESTHAVGDAQDTRDLLHTAAERAAQRGFWLDHRTFVPPAALVRIQIVEVS